MTVLRSFSTPVSGAPPTLFTPLPCPDPSVTHSSDAPSTSGTLLRNVSRLPSSRLPCLSTPLTVSTPPTRRNLLLSKMVNEKKRSIFFPWPRPLPVPPRPEGSVLDKDLQGAGHLTVTPDFGGPKWGAPVQSCRAGWVPTPSRPTRSTSYMGPSRGRYRGRPIVN